MSNDVKQLNKIKIKRNTAGDTRVATEPITPEILLPSNEEHISDVARLMNLFADDLTIRGTQHDHTKISNIDQMCKDMQEEQQRFKKDPDGPNGFTKSMWYTYHIATERHHLRDNCPEDVDLIDVIEQICDHIAAGLARSGKYTPNYGGRTPIDPETLMRAYNNTAARLLSQCEIEE